VGVFLRRDSGQAFLFVVLILAVLLVAGTTGVALASGLKRISMMQEWRTGAYFAAEAGAERALLRLAREPEWRDPAGFELAAPYLSSAGEQAGTIVRVRVVDAPTQPGFGRRVQITATGAWREAEQQIALTAVLASNTDLFNGFSILPDAEIRRVAVSGELRIEGPAGKGHLLIDGDLAVEVGGYVAADAYVSGRVEPGGRARIQGRVEEHFSGVPRFPTVDKEWLGRHATQVFAGDLSIGDSGEDDLHISTLAGHGIYFVEGTITIAGAYHHRATLVAGGDIRITGDLVRAGGDAGLLTLIALGGRDGARGDTAVLAENAVVDALILAQGSFSPAGDVALRGGVVARSLAPAGRDAPPAPAVRISCDTAPVPANVPPREAVRTRPRLESWVGG